MTLLLVGCGGSDGSEGSAPGSEGSGQAEPACENCGAGMPDVPIEQRGGSYALLCNSSGYLNFDVAGENLSRFEGQTVWVSAVQPQNSPHDARVTVLLQTVITSGAFTVSCPNSLEDNFWYPSYAVFVDSDGSGDCSSDDRYFQELLYGWIYNVSATVNFLGAFQVVGNRTTWGDFSVCEYYVPANLLN